MRGWKQWLVQFGVTEEYFTAAFEDLRRKQGDQMSVADGVWHVFNEMIAKNTDSPKMLSQIYRMMAAFLYNEHKDPHQVMQLCLRFHLLDMKELNARFHFDKVEIISECPAGSQFREPMTIDEALEKMPIPCRECTRNKDQKHPYGHCVCTWIPYIESPVEEQTAYRCPNCNSAVYEDDKECPHCHAEFEEV